MCRRFVSLLFSFMFALAPLAAVAVPITVPAGLHAGDHYRLVFVTSTVTSGNSTNIADYNAFVTNVAHSVPELAALPTIWHAVASTADEWAVNNTGTAPGDINAPTYTTGGALVATSNADLWDGTLVNGIGEDETGNLLRPIPLVWTGTIGNGGIGTHTSLGHTYTTELGSDRFSVLGAANTPGESWINADVSGRSGDPQYHLYAMSGILTAVPEPDAMVLAGMAVVGLALSSVRRRRGRSNAA